MTKSNPRNTLAEPLLELYDRAILRGRTTTSLTAESLATLLREAYRLGFGVGRDVGFNDADSRARYPDMTGR